MMLATAADYEYPHIDWVSDYSGSVYVSKGMPQTDHDLETDHAVTWSPNAEKIEEYIDLLESLEEGDGIVVCGDGPAPLMGPIESVGEQELITVSIDSPSRAIRWSRDKPKIEFKNCEREFATWDKVYHVETVEIQGEFK